MHRWMHEQTNGQMEIFCYCCNCCSPWKSPKHPGLLNKVDLLWKALNHVPIKGHPNPNTKNTNIINICVRQGISHGVGSWGQQGIQQVIELVDHGVGHGVSHGVSHEIGHGVIYGVMKCPQLLSHLTTITYN